MILWNTVIWIIVSVFFQLLLGLGLALLLRKPFKGRGLYSGLVFYPWALSGFAIGLLWSWLLNGQFGIINDILIKLNVIQEGIQFLSNPDTAMLSVLIVNIWYGIPFFAIMSLAALQSIPDSVYEAADIDGASGWAKLVKITLPYIRPTIISTVLVRSIWIMNFPDVIYGMTRGGPAKSTEILSTYMINIVYYENNYSKASAVGVIVILLLLVYTILYLRFSGQGEMEL
jgi:multiple sugar transport system permease protein